MQEFFEDNQPEQQNKRERILLIDYGNLSMRCLFAIPRNPLDYTFSTYKETIIRALKNLIVENSPSRVVIALEGGNNWRNDFYPEYKGQRAHAREINKTVDFVEFFKHNDDFLGQLREVMPSLQFIRVRRLEADDIIAIVTKTCKDSEIILVSSDRDFYQLHKYENFKQYNPIKKEFVNVINPRMALMEKIVTGDSADNIPSIQKGVGPKKFAKIFSERFDEFVAEHREAFERNSRLISFENIPNEFYKPVIDEMNNKSDIVPNKKEFFNFVVRNSLSNLLDDFEGIYSTLKLGDKDD